MRNLRENKHSRVCHLTRRIAHRAFFPNVDERLIDVMRRSASFDRAYVYDDFDRLATNGVFAEGYTYDALNRRVATTTLEGTMRHVYDNNWQVIADIDEQGNVVASYTWGEGIDKLLAVTVGRATYYALTDVQGTVWGYVDSQNNVVARWQYDAWGNVISEYVSPSAAALATLRYRFQGREWSVATGLINFRMRWYDAETGRWLSKDPIGLSGGLNLYAFCDCEAINFIDPYGNSSGVVLPVPLLLGPGLGPNWHHGGRSNRNKPLPLSQPIGDGWIQLPPWQSRYHDNGDPFPEKKFIHPDGREAVYDGKTGSLICDDDYGGTYNYVNPPVKGDAPWTYMWRSVGHFFSDMLPYYFWGN